MSWKFLSSFSSLIPSWRFFDQVGDIAQLSYRAQMTDGSFGPWTFYSPPRPESLLRWIFNPQGNLIQAQHSLIQRFAEEFSKTDQTKSLVSFHLIQQMVQKELGSSCHQFEWRITIWPEDTLIFVFSPSQENS